MRIFLPGIFILLSLLSGCRRAPSENAAPASSPLQGIQKLSERFGDRLPESHAVLLERVTKITATGVIALNAGSVVRVKSISGTQAVVTDESEDFTVTSRQITRNLVLAASRLRTSPPPPTAIKPVEPSLPPSASPRPNIPASVSPPSSQRPATTTDKHRVQAHVERIDEKIREHRAALERLDQAQKIGLQKKYGHLTGERYAPQRNTPEESRLKFQIEELEKERARLEKQLEP